MNQKELESAVLFKKLDVIKKAKHKGLNVNELTSSGNSLIHTALIDAKNQPEKAKIVVEELLLFPNVDIDLKNQSFKVSPFFSRLMAQDYEMAQFLLDKRANINSKNSLDRTPLYEAISEKDSIKVKFLLDNNADIKDTNPDKIPLSFIAVQNNMKEEVKLLLEKGDDLTVSVDVKGKNITIATFLYLNLKVDSDFILFIMQEVREKEKLPQFYESLEKTKERIEQKIHTDTENNNKIVNESVLKNISFINQIVSSVKLHDKLSENIDFHKDNKKIKI